MTFLQKTLVCLCIAGASSCITLFIYREYSDNFIYEDDDVFIEEIDEPENIKWVQFDDIFEDVDSINVPKYPKYKTYLA